MEIIRDKIGVRGVYKIRDLNVFDGFDIYYNGGYYSTTVNSNTSAFFNYIKR